MTSLVTHWFISFIHISRVHKTVMAFQPVKKWALAGKQFVERSLRTLKVFAAVGNAVTVNATKS